MIPSLSTLIKSYFLIINVFEVIIIIYIYNTNVVRQELFLARYTKFK